MSRVGAIVPLIITFAVARYAATQSRIDLRRALWLCAPALVAVVWFEALSSHTQFHLTVSSRSAAIALAIMLTAIAIVVERPFHSIDLWLQLRSLMPVHRPSHDKN
jgi:hypothetical protein